MENGYLLRCSRVLVPDERGFDRAAIMIVVKTKLVVDSDLELELEGQQSQCDCHDWAHKFNFKLLVGQLIA
jgi:hypothetical protein